MYFSKRHVISLLQLKGVGRKLAFDILKNISVLNIADDDDFINSIVEVSKSSVIKRLHPIISSSI